MSLKDFLKKREPQIFAIAFALILLLGIFLRTYNHHDWLRFNADQSRDALLVNNFLEGKIDLPLLGPKAGGTFFSLGPMFYYLQIASAKIFGTTPDKIAYPDLLFSILAIPLLYFLMRIYFNRYVSFSLTGLFSVSMFVVQYSRFAWNPNASPFFVFLFLYSLLMLASLETKKKMFWASVAGIAFGAGVQLHTLLLIIMPAIAVLFLGYFWKKKLISIKNCIAIFLIALALNTPQIISEIKTEGQNVRTFFAGTIKKTDGKETVLENLASDAACQIQANSYIISSYGNSDNCGVDVISSSLKKVKHFDKKFLIILELLLGTIFSIGGFLLWGRAVKKEKNQDKKIFLVLLGTYLLAVFVLLIPLANEISLRFYLALEFVPFMLLGFWIVAIIEWTKEKYRKHVVVFLIVVLLFLAGCNIFSVQESFAAVSVEEKMEDAESFITLGETEFISRYIISHSGAQKTVYVEGKQIYLFKYLKSIEYFTSQSGVSVRQKLKEEAIPEGATIFIIDDAKWKGNLKKSMQETYESYDVEAYGRFSIAMMQKKEIIKN